MTGWISHGADTLRCPIKIIVLVLVRLTQAASNLFGRVRSDKFATTTKNSSTCSVNPYGLTV
jgi:hypothetical protein